MLTLERPTLPTEAGIDAIHPSPMNPRKSFDPEGIAELAESIRQHGILEPLVVRADGGSYSLIAGERRFRAAQLAGLSTVPIRILEGIDDAKALQLMLVENLQRRDIDVIDEAEGYRQLHDVLGLTQTEIAKAVNRSQPSIANAMRVLDLPADVVEWIRAGELTRGHGVALARYKAFPELVSALAADAVSRKWTVKETESPGRIHQLSFNREDLMRRLPSYGDPPFDLTICLSCPFGAYVAPPTDERGQVYATAYCLRPAHYKELADLAAKKRNAELQRALAAVKAGGTEVLRVDRLQRGTYERLDNAGSLAPPAGCSDACPCYAKALQTMGGGTAGDRLVPICTDPARLRKLRAADAKALKLQRKTEYKLALAKLEQMVDAFAVQIAAAGIEDALLGTGKALAVIASAALDNARQRDVFKAVEKRHGVRLPEGLAGYLIKPEALERLQGWAAGRLLVIALETVLREDLYRKYPMERYSDGRRADWFLGDVKGEQ